MGGLTRNCTPLLLTVRGQAHASAADHEDGRKDVSSSDLSDPPEEEDINRDPDSSDAEHEAAPQYRAPAKAPKFHVPRGSRRKGSFDNIHGDPKRLSDRAEQTDQKAKESGGIRFPPVSKLGKRKEREEVPEPSREDKPEPGWVAGSQDTKRSKGSQNTFSKKSESTPMS